MERKRLIRLVIGMIVCLGTSLAFVGVTFAWFMGPNVFTDEDYLDGIVGLRNYFYTGDGTVKKPFEIVSPIHLYNLSRLQNLGVFSAKDEVYFQIGHDFTGEGVTDPEGNPVVGIKCMQGVDGSGNIIYSNILDMELLKSNGTQITIQPIGTEATPFFGTLDGNGLIIDHAKVAGYPDDIGLFGYISYKGSVNNLICSNLEVTSLGYSTNDRDEDYILYSKDVAVDLNDVAAAFDDNRYFLQNASLWFCPSGGDPYTLKETGAHSITNIDASAALDIVEEPCIIAPSGSDPSCSVDSSDESGYEYGCRYRPVSKGYFKLEFNKAEGDPFDYELQISDSLLRFDKVDGKVVAKMDLTDLRDSAEFNNGGDNEAEARVYITASISIGGYSYSRVIQSYRIVFNSNNHAFGDEEYSADVYCDYSGKIDDVQGTNYQHGINIGLLAGHVDGAMDRCYVYNGTIKFNSGDGTSYESETETGLIGEIGRNVNSNLSPELGLTVRGDTGVMNFTNIYGLIRDDFEVGDTTYAGSEDKNHTLYKFISYDGRKKVATIDRYSDFLRYDATSAHYFITSASNQAGIPASYNTGGDPNYTLLSGFDSGLNSVDFLWNKVIADEKDGDVLTVDRGMGVFKVVTSRVELPVDYSDALYSNYVYSGLGDSCIKNSAKIRKVYFSTAECDWRSGMANWNTISPTRMNTIPEYSDAGSFKYPFSRDFNYVFELDLSQAEGREDRKNFMWNTDNPFLTNYLRSILIDKYGVAISWKDQKFGMMLRTTVPDEPIVELSSFMPVKKLTSTSDYSGTYYPPSSIVFKIDSEHGANVSIVGNGDDISVYKFNYRSSGSCTELYSMKSKNAETMDMHRYFEYDYSSSSNGETTTEATVLGGDMKDNGSTLYGHIFTLPQSSDGEYYAVGAHSGTANIYYLAVQGQNDAEYGERHSVLTGKAVQNVDFLLNDPTEVGFNLNSSLAEFSFEGTFNTSSGTLTAAPYTLNAKTGINVTFNDDVVFTTYLLGYCRKGNPVFFFNEVIKETTNADYTEGDP